MSPLVQRVQADTRHAVTPSHSGNAGDAAAHETAHLTPGNTFAPPSGWLNLVPVVWMERTPRSSC